MGVQLEPDMLWIVRRISKLKPSPILCGYSKDPRSTIGQHPSLQVKKRGNLNGFAPRHPRLQFFRGHIEHRLSQRKIGLNRVSPEYRFELRRKAGPLSLKFQKSRPACQNCNPYPVSENKV